MAPTAAAAARGDSLNVIALVSGGKDSFFSLLHCLANGHHVVALANLYPSDATPSTGTGEDGKEGEETDLNSFMYQTVGHQVIPLYAEATGLPLFRQPIVGSAVQSGISYKERRTVTDEDEDETESLIPLLRTVLRAHPEVNALCAGAILSTYQRTRVESVALRLGLVPLAYLWQFPVLPPPGHGPRDDAQLLRDMAAAGLEARIIKVASAGLNEDFLWANVASETTIGCAERALRRFGGGGDKGSILGEGGEFETLVVDGPKYLFKGKILIEEEEKRVVREGGGNAWLSIRGASVVKKHDDAEDPEQQNATRIEVRTPSTWDPAFEAILEELRILPTSRQVQSDISSDDAVSRLHISSAKEDYASSSSTQQWCFSGNPKQPTIQDQTSYIVNAVQEELQAHSLQPNAITSTIIVLRRMSDFTAINKIYGSLFPDPNPPSRVAISCGDRLPDGASIAVYLTVQSHLDLSQDRQGLHVQSRSYWAPANIGPYSQAISTPIFSTARPESTSTGPQVVSIAGQIPLIPASMTLPVSTREADDSDSFSPVQITLALQHLWRIALEMHIQWWISAVAYFPRASSSDSMQRNALLAAHAWRAAHLSSASSGDEEDEDGPDVWDRKYNSQYMSFSAGADDEAAREPRLPDWIVCADVNEDAMQDDPESATRARIGNTPFVFAAEIEELPRAAGVEWHAHNGLAKLSEGSVHVISRQRSRIAGLQGRLEMQHVIIESGSGEVFVQSTAAMSRPTKSAAAAATAEDLDEVLRILAREVGESLASVTEGMRGLIAEEAARPHLVYVDSDYVSRSRQTEGPSTLPIIPCHSLWNGQGQRLFVVTLYQRLLTKANK